MATTRPLTLRLEPKADSRLISGWLCDQRGDEHYFAGWLGLLTLLEEARLMATSEPRDVANNDRGS
jgi:hypothetical protein